MFKFRSMIKNADKIHAELRAKSSNQVNKRMFKDPNDPRLTRVGRFIRRFSIDELPQIFNVLNGTMSMVGPRPPLKTEVAEYSNNDHRRLLVKPGITGLWQVSGRSTLSWEETVRLDLYYVENWSLSGDIFIILRTFKAVVSRTGAY
jgi:lipopolysaccharide/colanic/teichoic acid biosynthesis glycosyltransferase